MSKFMLLSILCVAFNPSYGQAQDAQVIFDSKNIDLYEMTPTELLKVSPQKLTNEIELLKGRNQVEQNELLKLQKINDTMCLKLASLKKSCTIMTQIADIGGHDGLNCGQSNTDQIIATLNGGGGESYRLIANEKYISNELSGNGQTEVRFSRNDSKLVKPPRFRDLTTLSLVAIKPGGSIGQRTKRSPTLIFDLKINDRYLLNDFTLNTPSDASDLSTFLVNPEEVLDLRQKQGCAISMQELQQLNSSH